MTLSPPRDGDPERPNKLERRTHPRRSVSPRLYVVLYGADSDGVLYDVSEGGAALDILGSQPDGEYVVVDFEMAEINRQFEAKARITWRDEEGKKVGIRFIDLPEATRIQLREWLLKKMPVGEDGQPALVQDAERPTKGAAPGTRAEALPAQCVAGLEAVISSERGVPRLDAAPPPGEPKIARDGDRLVQNLIDSFGRRSSLPARSIAQALANLFSAHPKGFSTWTSRRWMALTAAVCLVVLLVLGVVAYRSPARNVGINVSKVGQLPRAETETNASDSAANANDLPAPGVPPTVLPPLSVARAGQPSCIDAGSTSDKIRIYLWSEKDTPAAITTAYANHLRAVLDVRIVNSAPYDLVLYVNGANAVSAHAARGAESGYIWSSRVFRSWYCGQTPGLLEQTQVNESLHYVEGANLDRHIESEVAYLILHTFETIRKEHTR